MNKAVDFKKYNKVLIDPVLIYKEGELDADQRANFEKLAHNLYVYLTQELGKDYKIVQTPEPGTWRLSTAIVSADKTAVVRNVLTTIIPVGMAISTVQYAATGKPSATGEITVEGRVTDAMTGQLLPMGIDKQVGGKTLKGMTESWYSADQGAKAIAKMIRYNACKVHAVPGVDCEAIKP